MYVDKMGAAESRHRKNKPKSMSRSTSDVGKIYDVTNTEPENLSVVSESVLNFTSDVFKIFELDANLKENYICSTLSAHIVLTMVAYGADRNTAEEMRKVLQISDSSELLENYQKLIDILNTKANTGADHNLDKEFERTVDRTSMDDLIPKSVVTLANKIYISNNCKVKEGYENILDTYFKSKSQSVNFSEPSKTAKIINAWCGESTNGKITKILESNDIDESIVLILMNAVYFKGMWIDEFETAIPKTFHLNKFNKIKVPTMYLDRELLYKKIPELNAQAVCLHFEGDNYMEIIVPNAIDGLETIRRNLKKISHTRFKCTNVRLWLPKFQLESTIELTKHLIDLGMVEAFDSSLADFNKMCDEAVCIGKVLQKAYVKVDEKGCEAAAVTLVEMCQICADMPENPTYITVEVNRPFLFRIMDTRFKIPLFIGSVVNPGILSE